MGMISGVCWVWKRGILQGLKPLEFLAGWRPKAKALGTQKQRQMQISLWVSRKAAAKATAGGLIIAELKSPRSRVVDWSVF
jgi:hypothetical protein